MDEKKLLADRFEAHRAHLRKVAYRMLGSTSEADDAVQEAWLRLSRSDTEEVGNLGGWLTTVVARVCLDMLRSRKSRREEPMGPDAPEPVTHQGDGFEPEQEQLMADSIGVAMLVVLQTLAPAERVAFVLHDMFDLPFDEIAPIVGRSATATRQLASRARRRVQGKGVAADSESEIGRKKQIVDAFLAAARGGDFEALLAVLDPDVVTRGDETAIRLGGPAMQGAQAVAQLFKGRAQAARSALIDGAVGATVAPGGRLLLVLNFTIRGEKIVAIEAIADPDRLAQTDIEPFDA